MKFIALQSNVGQINKAAYNKYRMVDILKVSRLFRCPISSLPI